MNNLIIFATYWNEIDWIWASLAQIDKLDPLEVIICDGCFDPSVPNYSTDGTREIIEKYVNARPNARMMSAVRVSKLRGVLDILKGNRKSRMRCRYTPGRLKAVVLSSLVVEYRLNQALTFQRMIELSECWEPDRWFMTYDCDQFYSDEMVEAFRVVNERGDVGLLVGRELTFFEDFERYTDEYDQRGYNNMPHKIYPETTFIPTRGVVIETWGKKSFGLRNTLLKEFYIRKVPTLHVGYYFHYKFRFCRERVNAGYRLGDRKKPDSHEYRFRVIDVPQPKIIQESFPSLASSH